MTTKASLASALLAISLAACGGGGGSSATPSAPTTQAALRSGFAGVGPGGTQSFARRTQSLSSALEPVADFIVPDSYISYKPYLITSATALAYYDTSLGGLLPSVLPTGTWSENGIPLTTSAPVFGANLLGNPSSVSDEVVNAPAVEGKATLTFKDALGQSTSLVSYSYGATALDTKYLGGYAGTQPCLTFNADGSAAPVVTGGDLCLVTNPDNTTSVVAPHGAVAITKTIDAVGVADIAAVPSTSTTIGSAVFAASSSQTTVIARTALGSVVKFQPMPISAGVNGCGTPQGCVDYLYGPYRVGSPMTGWDE